MTDSAQANVILSAAFSGLGFAVIIIYRDMMNRVVKLERQFLASLSLMTRIAMKVGVDEQVIHDIQKAIMGSNS